MPPIAPTAQGISFFARGRQATETNTLGVNAGQVLGDFRLIRPLGQGAMGQVWEALQQSLDRHVALKLVRPERVSEKTLALFAREARAGGRLQHPNLVSVHGHGTDAGVAWIAMELVEGARTLRDFLDEAVRATELPEGYHRDVARFVAEVADGMQAAHAAGVIHRDLKPQNILVAPDSRPKVSDFGLAKLIDEAALSDTGDFAGTYWYASPEQVAGRRMGLDHRTDVFSLGVVLYELLAHRRPFEGDTTQQVVAQILTVDPPDLRVLRSRTPRALAVITAKCLEKSPARRYRTMEELAQDLRRFLRDEAILARPTGRLVKLGVWARRNPTKSVAGSVGVVALVAVSSLLAANVRANASLQRTLGERDGLITELESTNTSLAEQTRVAREEAERAERAAEAERLAATAEKRRADEVLRLSAIQNYEDLLAEADRLWPPYPEQIQAYERWLTKAQALVDELPEYYRKRDELRALALPPTEADTEGSRREWRFPPWEDSARWWNANLTKLIEALEGLADPKTGLLSSASDAVSEVHGWSIARRLDFARSIEERSVTGPDAQRLWSEAIAAIAVSSKYDGLALKPQLGLLPIGADPESGLWEFAHLATGEVPARDGSGQIVRTESMGVVLVLIPGGTFWMGAQKTDPTGLNYDPDARDAEKPVHSVTVSPYFISKYEMTQMQWLRLSGINAAYYKQNDVSPSLLHPVEQVSWNDCMVILPRIGLSLPSEAQWEHGARGGTTWPRWVGGTRDALLAGHVNIADRSFVNWTGLAGSNSELPSLDDGTAGHGAIGFKSANAFGLHEVLGNVGEWCLDERAVYATEHRTDPIVSGVDPSRRVSRGGSFFETASSVRSAIRGFATPDHRTPIIGFRPVYAINL